MKTTKRRTKTAPNAEKIPAVSITLTRAEGPTDLCGTVTIEGGSHVDVWQMADTVLRGWALTAPASGGYDKCDFTVRYADGETYEGHYDLKRQDDTKPVILGAHVYAFVTCTVGLCKPDWMTDDQYQEILDADKRYSPEFRKQMTTFFNTYEIRD